MKLYNFLSLGKKIFKPLKNKKVGLYTCGPTVYAPAHLGNLRTYIFEDVLRRTLKYNGYQVKQVQNITDIEDKIIKKMKQENKSLTEITGLYSKIFFNDLKKLNIEKAEVYPKATAHIKEMISLIKKLMAKKIAYQGRDGSIYFNISKFKNYGRLSRLEKRKIKIGARITADEYNKEQAQDFVLWKHAKSAPSPVVPTMRMRPYEYKIIAGEPVWQSPWGWGRPGWHIECSAMSMKYLGETFDIHAGGVDLIFPHHENEIAQSEAVTGKKFANYWIYGEHLLIHGQKMAKSLGNFYTLQDIENRSFKPASFRYLILTSHYRSKLNFTWNSLKAAQNAMDNLIYNLQSTTNNQQLTTNNDKKIWKYEKLFLTAINDDLNTPKAIAVIWQIIKNKKISNTIKKKLIIEFDAVLGLNLNKIKPFKIPQAINDLIKQREISRTNKQFIKADALRKEIEKLGYIIEDTVTGPKARKKL